jgi:hypothetical protein
MIHGPCGSFNNNSPCMCDGNCTKKYPRKLVSDTTTGNDGYPLYCRRSVEDGGKSVVLKVRNIDIEVDNRWIVPYSPLLSKTFKAHINVEYCNSVKSIKYICKYVNKGSDMAVFGVGNVAAPLDEINQYQLGRYISSNEAVWRILSFPIHERHPTVVYLAVHLENGHRVYFKADNVRTRALVPPATTLTAFYFTAMIFLLRLCFILRYRNSTRGMHRLKSFNVAKEVKQLKDIPIYIPVMHRVVCKLFIRTIQNSSI